MFWNVASCELVIITDILEDRCASSSMSSSPRRVMDPEGGDSMILQNISNCLPTDML